jgi:[NiFe] hydrogenase assembly HybE family chaperone
VDAPQAAELAQRFERTFARIQTTRMQGIPLLNPALRVAAIGFAPCREREGAHGVLGALLTPWFLNLVWAPQDGAVPPVGVTHWLALASGEYEFLGAYEDGLGSFAMASLYSPVFEFTAQEDAVAVATAALDLLRAPAAAGAAAPVPQTADASRRAFLLGRGM